MALNVIVYYLIDTATPLQTVRGVVSAKYRYLLREHPDKSLSFDTVTTVRFWDALFAAGWQKLGHSTPLAGHIKTAEEVLNDVETGLAILTKQAAVVELFRQKGLAIQLRRQLHPPAMAVLICKNINLYAYAKT